MFRPLEAIRRMLGLGERRSSILAGGALPAAPVLSGTYVTPQTALCLAAVYGGINVISRDIASMPRAIERKLPGGGWILDDAKPQQELIMVSPADSGEMDSFSYWQTAMGHVLGWGNSFSEIVRDTRNGDPRELRLLHPAKTIPKRTEAGNLYYELDNKRTLAPENVLHFSGLGFDGVRGYSCFTVCRQTIGLAIGAEQFGAAMFGNGLIAKGILKTAKKLGTAAINNLRSSLGQVHQGSQSAHQLMILEEGIDWTNTQISPEDGQWLGTRAFQVLDIARMLCLPPHKIGDYSQSHMANVEESNLDYITTTLGGWVATLEAQANLKLLTREDRKTHRIRFDMEALMRANTAGRMTRYQILRNLGAINADEIRLKEGMNPIGAQFGGDLYVIQGQYMPLNQVGKQPVPPDPPELRTEPPSPLILNGRFHANS